MGPDQSGIVLTNVSSSRLGNSTGGVCLECFFFKTFVVCVLVAKRRTMIWLQLCPGLLDWKPSLTRVKPLSLLPWARMQVWPLTWLIWRASWLRCVLSTLNHSVDKKNCNDTFWPLTKLQLHTTINFFWVELFHVFMFLVISSVPHLLNFPLTFEYEIGRGQSGCG